MSRIMKNLKLMIIPTCSIFFLNACGTMQAKTDRQQKENDSQVVALSEKTAKYGLASDETVYQCADYEITFNEQTRDLFVNGKNEEFEVNLGKYKEKNSDTTHYTFQLNIGWGNAKFINLKLVNSKNSKKVYLSISKGYGHWKYTMCK